MLVQTIDFVIPGFVKVPCGDRVTNCSPNGKVSVSSATAHFASQVSIPRSSKKVRRSRWKKQFFTNYQTRYFESLRE